MKKQKKQLVWMVILLIVLVGGYFGLVKYNEWSEQKEQDAAQSDVIYVTQLEADSIQKISYDYEGETISLVKDGETWVYEGDTSLAIVQSTVETMAKRMAEIQAELSIPNVTDMEQYGLGEGARKVTFSTADTTYSFRIGDYNSTSFVYYWGAEGDSIVYVVGGENVTCFAHGLEDLLEEVEESAEESSTAE
ncbi:MAG: DUF4340 domain-containing protein [Lachnospiraceae bacterium]|nr:DUF4340 domain-containing protein [Lachnospiraceae bacterium]